MLVVVAGIPGSGKTTLSRQLQALTGWPLVSKDVIKEALFDEFGTGDNAWAARLSSVAHHVMLRLVPDLGRISIVEAHFRRGVAELHLAGLGVPMVQVYCRCPVEVAWARYQARRDDPTRHPGHLADHQDEEATRHWRDGPATPLDLSAPLIEIDTSGPVDVADLARRITALAGEPELSR